MKTTRELLDRLNELRKREGLAPIKEWKKKRDALLPLIEELEELNRRRRKDRPRGVKLADIARQCGRTEKSARQKMRKYKSLPGVPRPITPDRWLYDPSDVEEVKKWLAADRRREHGLGTDRTKGRVQTEGDPGADQDDRLREEPVVVRLQRPEILRARKDDAGSAKTSREGVAP